MLPVQDLVGMVKEVKRGMVCRIVSQIAQISLQELSKEIFKQLEKAKKEIE